jgi:hypothetical protein
MGKEDFRVGLGMGLKQCKSGVKRMPFPTPILERYHALKNPLSSPQIEL